MTRDEQPNRLNTSNSSQLPNTIDETIERLKSIVLQQVIHEVEPSLKQLWPIVGQSSEC